MHLKSLELSGFKSFAKKSNLEFVSAITAIVGPNGSGKCVEGGTKVQLRTGEIIRIQDFFDRACTNTRHIKYLDDGVVVLGTEQGCEVATLNQKTLKQEWRPVQAFIRRTAPKELLEITTRTGRTITATSYHPVFVLEDGVVKAQDAEKLHEGVRIAVPRVLNVESTPQRLLFTEVLAAFEHSDLVYLPSTHILTRHLRDLVTTAGSITQYARTQGLSPEVVQRVLGRQSLNAAYVTSVFPQEDDESTLFQKRTLKSKTHGYLRIPLEVDECLARFLGYIISEGRNTPTAQVWFVNDDRAIINDFVTCARRCFDITPSVFSYKEGPAKDIIIFSKTLCRLLDRVFGIKIGSISKEKQVPPQIFTAPNSVVSAFLSALFAGDGYFTCRTKPRRQAYVEYATASEVLARDVAALLLRFDIIAIVKSKKKYASNTEKKTRRTYWSVYIYGDEQLSRLAAVLKIAGRKQKILEQMKLLSFKSNPNIDLIPGVLEELHILVREAAVKLKPLRRIAPTLTAYYERRCQPSRGGILSSLRIVEQYGEMNNSAVRRAQKLRQIAESDVLWDEVVSIRKKKGEKYVYDLTVAGTHNFVANDFFVHNSNIAEAFRFVLGEQSMKSMRGRRGEDLIFSGTQGAPRSNRASVKLLLDNQKRLLDIDFDEVSIERVVHRDGVNQYSINGSQVRLRDVIELLAGANIGASGHHIISQGESDRILSANPKERREMIEDALGLKIYQYKRQESERKLLKTGENIEQVSSLRKEIAPHLRFLSRQVEKIEKAKNVRDELVNRYKEYLKRESLYITFQKESLAREKDAPQKELDALERELQGARRALEQSSGKDEKSDEILNLEKELSQVRAQKETLTRSLGRLEGQISFQEKAVEREKSQGQGKTSVVSFKEVTAIVEDVEGKMEEALQSDDVSLLKSILKSVKETLRDFIESHAKRRESVSGEKEKKELERLCEEEIRLEADMKQISAREADLGGKYKKLSREIEGVKDKSRALERDIFEMMTKINELKSALNSIEHKEDRLQQDEEEFKRELAEAGALMGRVVLDYENYHILGKNGNEVSVEDVVKENRAEQQNRRREVEKMKIRLEELGGGSVDEIIKEYKEVSERDAFLEREIADLEKSAASLHELIEELKEKLDTKFKEGIEKINTEFQHFFTLMFGGGTASLSVVKEKKQKRIADTFDVDAGGEGGDEVFRYAQGRPEEFEGRQAQGEEALRQAQGEEETEEGIDIAVSLPHKRIKGLVMLSGGERALTSIALIFAMSQVNPPPFLILDETDAALDEANSKRYSDMIENLAKKSQLVLITHNRETMGRAGILYGVTMGAEGVSKLLSIKFEEAVQVAK